ncbi:MAG: type III-B CRISPR module-associated Cmr3 family protein [Cyanobacteria bacterium J06592_8]
MLKYLIRIQPLGLLYGSSGRFLSPENLVGRSGQQFPPTAATLSGLFAYFFQQNNQPELLENLLLSGPFWAKEEDPQNFYVPTPFNCLVQDKVIKDQMVFDGENWKVWSDDEKLKDKKILKTPPDDKFQKGTWISVKDWEKLQNPKGEKPEVETSPWKFLPHLHPRLQHGQRRVATEVEENQGSLFLENAVQLDPEICLVYLSNTKITDGWYRFGGEGHLVKLTCEPLEDPGKSLLNKDLERSFALVVPAVWGSNRQSYRSPEYDATEDRLSWPENSIDSLLTQRPQPFRYRLGKRKTDQPEKQTQPPGLLSRGRYAVPAGSVYVLEKPLKKWQDWETSWFPQEGYYSLKRWGCGLALPLNVVVKS